MGPFDYVMMLMSFVYAMAIAHLLATVGDIIAAWGRVRFSWLNFAWMLYALLGVLTWWLGMWGLRNAHVWAMSTVAVFFTLAAILYLEVRLVCARIPAEGPVDLPAFHKKEGPKYMTAFAVLTGFTLFVNLFYFGSGQISYLISGSVYRIVLIQCLASLAGAVFSHRIVQIASAIIVGAMWVSYYAILRSSLA